MATRYTVPKIREPFTQARKAFKPVRSQVCEMDRETRFDLPFAVSFEHISYIGIVRRDTWHVHPHYHDHFELCYVDEGEGWFAIDDFSYAVKAGDLFLTRPGEIHQGAAAGALPYRLYYLGFSLDRFSTLEIDYYQIGLHRVCADNHDTVKDIFEEIFHELHTRPSHALEMVQSHFLRLLVSVLRIYDHMPTPTLNTPTMLNPALREVLTYLHADAGCHHSIESLALLAHLSRSHLTREFKRSLGVSPGTYMRTLCLEWARLYLRETSDTVSLIAERLHFSSIHTFSIFFKRHTGLSPQEYRKTQGQSPHSISANG